LDAGIVRPQLQPVFLPGLLAELAESFKPFAERKGLRLAVRCPDITVTTDVMLLQRILQNLVSNAVRYTGAGGIVLAARRRAGGIRVDVFDTGCGIAAEERDLVFEEFFRGGARTGAAEEPGLGLGLSIVRRMAQALDHPLTLASRPGHGTRVTLGLPLSEVPAAPAPAAPVATRLSGAHVLVVENDASTADALARLLQNWDARVSTFRDLAGVRGAVEAGAAPPDILVLDYHLDDGACGLDVAAYLRGRSASPLPAIVTTADHSEAIEARVAEAGAELVHKPIKPAQLRSLLTYMLA
ncbi:ATP-binding protein, partial [Methylobacterium sp. J-077]|uniref:ATP-binding protein n=1 Tax=Methylobacterium sp. J-077 TaxID=2836656 RepID=UPI001FBB8CDE